MLAEAREACEQAAADHGCEVELRHLWSIPPIPFDDRLIGLAREAVVEAGGKDTAIPSGPLHDAAEMARLIPTVMLFSSSSPPVSHTKEEDTPEATSASRSTPTAARWRRSSRPPPRASCRRARERRGLRAPPSRAPPCRPGLGEPPAPPPPGGGQGGRPPGRGAGGAGAQLGRARPPAAPPHPPEGGGPLRGKPLRDKIVLRLIAVNRALHFLVLGAIAALIFVFASHRDALRSRAYRVIVDLQTGAGGGNTPKHGILHEIERGFSLRSDTIKLVGAVFAVYAVVEGLEAWGLWYQRRWAEYLTFLVTASLLPLEIYELSRNLTPFKLITFVINVAVVAYLLIAKRLFGLRGGAAADARERAHDVGWEALERTAPEAVAATNASVAPAARAV